MKEIRCKKCRLTYDKKNKRCPYCKHPKPKTGIIIFLSILLIVGGLILYYISFGNPFNSKVKNFDGIKFEITNISGVHDSLLGYDCIKCDFELTNTTTFDETFDCSIKAYVDDYEATIGWGFSDKSIYSKNLVAGKKAVETITIDVNNTDWKKIELYYSVDDSKYQKLYTITQNDIKSKTH